MQTSTERLALIQQMDLMDDVFFQKVVEDETVCEEILRVLLQEPDLKVIEAQTQRFLRNIGAHSAILDLDLPGWGRGTDQRGDPEVR